MEFYVYIYRDPLRDNVPIYVGKGKGDRAWVHQHPHSRFGRISRRCVDAGKRFAPEIVAEFEYEDDAYRHEAKLIFEYGLMKNGTGTLMNLVAGRWMKRGWTTPWVEEIKKQKYRRRRPGKNQRERQRQMGMVLFA